LRSFQKRQTGNPKGIYGSSAYHEARRICAEATPDAAGKQVELMSSSDERVAFMATEAVLNRGAGRPRDHSDEPTRRIDLSALTEDERETLLALLKRRGGSDQPKGRADPIASASARQAPRCSRRLCFLQRIGKPPVLHPPEHLISYRVPT
jgi:hypothetical protein